MVFCDSFYTPINLESIGGIFAPGVPAVMAASLLMSTEGGLETCPSAPLVRSSSPFPTHKSLEGTELKGAVKYQSFSTSAVCDNREMEEMVPTSAYLTHSPTPDTFTVKYEYYVTLARFVYDANIVKCYIYI